MKRTLQFLLVAALAIPAFAKSGDALSLVPTNAVSVGVVKVGDLRTSPLSAILFQHTDHVSTNGEADKFLTDAGLDPKKDVDVLVVATSPKTNLGSEADVLVAAEGRFNVDRLTSALTTRGAIKKTAGNATYFTTPKDSGDDHKGAVAFVNSGLTLMGTEDAVVAALAALANGGTNFKASNLGMDAARIDAGATAWAIVDVTRAKRLTGTGPNTRHGKNEALNAAIKNVSTVGVWATDTGDALKLDAFGLTSDGETLELLEDTLRGVLAAARLAVQDKAPDMVSVLRRFSVSRTNDAIKISGSIPADALRKLTAKKQASK
jgi:hypothetical protein